MALSDEKREAKGVQFHKCPSCGKRYDFYRTYCDCHTRLEDRAYWDDDKSIPIEATPNVEYPNFTCANCGAGCQRCYSFSAPKQNHRGFGGENCVQRQDTLRCACCQAIRRLGCSLVPVIPVVMDVKEMWNRRGA
jgi:hypothetical protein